MFEGLIIINRLFTLWHTVTGTYSSHLSSTQASYCCPNSRWHPLCVCAFHQGLKSHSLSERTKLLAFQGKVGWQFIKQDIRLDHFVSCWGCASKATASRPTTNSVRKGWNKVSSSLYLTNGNNFRKTDLDFALKVKWRHIGVSMIT